MTIASFRTGFERKALRALACVVVAVSASSGTSSLACGYHSPQTVALGALNWSYPDALYVRTALWQAEVSGILPPRPSQHLPAALAFRRAQVALGMFADRLSRAGRQGDKPMSIAVVLIDSMLWTRFVASSKGYDAHIDVAGAESGDVVIVTASKVIEAIVRGSYDANLAELNGLIRLYRRPEFHNDLRRLLAPLPASGKLSPELSADPAADR